MGTTGIAFRHNICFICVLYDAYYSHSVSRTEEIKYSHTCVLTYVCVNKN